MFNREKMAGLVSGVNKAYCPIILNPRWNSVKRKMREQPFGWLKRLKAPPSSFIFSSEVFLLYPFNPFSTNGEQGEYFIPEKSIMLSTMFYLISEVAIWVVWVNTTPIKLFFFLPLGLTGSPFRCTFTSENLQGHAPKIYLPLCYYQKPLSMHATCGQLTVVAWVLSHLLYPLPRTGLGMHSVVSAFPLHSVNNWLQLILERNVFIFIIYFNSC